MESENQYDIPRAFIWRRLQSIAGLWLVAYLIMHLFTNSQAAFFFGENGMGFIKGVNSIHDLPYLPVIEITLLAVPIILHALWGIIYICSADYNSISPKDGSAPYLPYPRNRAYTWQRITSWLLLVGIIAHVIHMRVIEYPLFAEKGAEQLHMVRVTADEGLFTLSQRIGVTLYDKKQIESLKEKFKQEKKGGSLVAAQMHSQEMQWLTALSKRPLKDDDVMAVSDKFGPVELLMVRDTFKMPLMAALYTLFVLAACFHAFNGLWTFMIKWGVTLTQRSQRLMRWTANILMVLVAAMGLSAIWLTYWVNLKQ